VHDAASIKEIGKNPAKYIPNDAFLWRFFTLAHTLPGLVLKNSALSRQVTAPYYSCPGAF
jgi:hypothetical protein